MDFDCGGRVCFFPPIFKMEVVLTPDDLCVKMVLVQEIFAVVEEALGSFTSMEKAMPQYKNMAP